ncbi:hypothetical protein [Candidatus Uabimicrobium sp. HlEnr_7]|uniref:hypothetical protein n=1 Tax=Candidatus Uabimicrobium helgolandensis TaxID=3095367 RepID=UPI003557BD64
MTRILLLTTLVLFFSPIFARGVEYKNIKMGTNPAMWQKQLEQDGKDGWRFIEVSSGWATLVRGKRKKSVRYYFAKAFKGFGKYQKLVEEKVKEGWRTHGKHDGWFIFSKLANRIESKFLKKASIAERWHKQVEQEGREGWLVNDVSSGWFVFTRKNKRAISYKFVKPSRKERDKQIETESKDNWVYLGNRSRWLIFAR